jgi:hypothetical protein
VCPECFIAIALLVTGVVSTGGITAATVKLLRNKKIAAKIRVSEFALTNPESKQIQGNEKSQ